MAGALSKSANVTVVHEEPAVHECDCLHVSQHSYSWSLRYNGYHGTKLSGPAARGLFFDFII